MIPSTARTDCSIVTCSFVKNSIVCAEASTKVRLMHNDLHHGVGLLSVWQKLTEKSIMHATQAIMAAAKQQHQQHMTDMQSHLQEASEAAQHAQAAEAEVTQAAEQLVIAAQADRAAATAAANQTEATLQRFKDTLVTAEHTRALTTRQHTESLKIFVLATVNDAVSTAVRQATASWHDLSGTARQARGLLEGVSSEIADSMQAAGRSIEERLMQALQSAIADRRQSRMTCASPGQLQPNQVMVLVLPFICHLQVCALAASLRPLHTKIACDKCVRVCSVEICFPSCYKYALLAYQQSCIFTGVGYDI